MKRKTVSKLVLSKETLRTLNPQTLGELGAAAPAVGTALCILSIKLDCVSLNWCTSVAPSACCGQAR